MNRLSTEQRARIVACLVEGNSIRATVRMTGAAKNTVTKLLVDLGEACWRYQDQALVNLPCERVQCDEIWAFCYAKAKNVPQDKQGRYGYGDVWTWTAIDADTKLAATWWVGGRSNLDAHVFLRDLRDRMRSRIQLSTDGLGAYLTEVERTFGPDADFAQIIKEYGPDPQGDHRRYSPSVCTGIEIKIREGDPDPAHISTSYVERQNLTMRMSMRRFTRLTNGFSKKVQNLEAAVSLHFMHYNFARPHKTLSRPYPTTPAMAAGVTDHVWSLEEIVGLMEIPTERTDSN